jgi:hypothetical protein
MDITWDERSDSHYGSATLMEVNANLSFPHCNKRQADVVARRDDFQSVMLLTPRRSTPSLG